MTGKGDVYTCALCGGTFRKGQSDEEAASELSQEFPGYEPAECAIVCDDCWKEATEG